MNKKADQLMLDIRFVMVLHAGTKMTTTSIINRVFGTHGADSNHPMYRKVLRRLNRMYAQGVIKAERSNPYKAGEWWMDGHISDWMDEI